MAEATAQQQKDSGNGGMWLTLLAILMGTFVAILNNSLINVALPTLVNVFGSTTDTIQWVLTGYMLANAVVIPMSGSLGDKFGYKKIFLTSLIGFTASSVLCALAWSDTSIIAFRIIQGLTGGFIMPIGMSMIYMVVPREKIGMALGLFGIASMVAPAVGPTFGGYLIQYLSWKFLFLISVPFGIFAIIMSSALLKETTKKPDLKFDYSGAILSIIAFGTLLLALSKGQSEGWTSFYIVSLLFTAFSSMALFIWVELGKEEPLLDLSLFKIPIFTLSVITSGFVMMGMMGAIFMMPLFLQNIQGMTAMDSGLLLMPQSIAMAVMMPVGGKLLDKFGIGPIALVGLTVMGVTTYELHNLEIDTPHHLINTIMTIRGLGIGLCMMTLSTVGMNAVPRQIVGKASSLSNVIRQVMSSFGIAILTMVMTTRTNFHSVTISESISITSTTALEFIKGLTGIYAQAGVDAATAQGGASSVLIGMMMREATVRGIADAMLFSAIPIFCSLPLIFFMHKKPKKPDAPQAKEKAAA
ncbi:DHA2 family efflux MFS transporter permease subunit [Brevibacillus ruminantium]|uniref:DHA2 family efflux MFS transporter permease subunit n=1 Tax=Brevibacillus ruminantium TaxID=2950604 RepID=A0ABY4WCF7_9BACL|nr:DHA2 family efflux MFS transporter permease subunit [Brevibacillus ruminantium]USG64424.1 DHA2 family efflux MFS transporter permease subunit [Brevibacillus ruminantium]